MAFMNISFNILKAALDSLFKVGGPCIHVANDLNRIFIAYSYFGNNTSNYFSNCI